MNGVHKPQTLNRAAEVEDLIDAVKSLVIPFIRAADDEAPQKATGRPSLNPEGLSNNVLVDAHKPESLVKQLAFSLPEKDGLGRAGLLDAIQQVLKYSVNTWDQGFLDKLYASTNAVGVASDLVLSVLNTNLHVYQVSPALTVIEKHTARAFANLFGFTGPRAGGFTAQGGSSSNLTSIVVARNALYPDTKTAGNAAYDFVLFTSAHGHYSVQKAAMTCGFGSSAVWAVPVDPAGRLDPAALRELVVRAKAEGKTPFYVNATAGTTVLGSFDPFEEIAAVCAEFGLWMHIDGSWGGPAIFSARQRHKLKGSHLANSLTVNPHKMLNCPATCSFFLGPDVDVFHRANTLPAAYLFHAADTNGSTNGDAAIPEVWDMADLTLQCGRRGDSLKLALSWIHYGPAGFESQVDWAFGRASRLASAVTASPDLVLVSSNPPPCLQVCFYYAPGGRLADEDAENTRRTKVIVERLVGRGFMVDYAPGPKGFCFRVVVNCQTLDGTVDGLVKAAREVGKDVVG